MKRIRLLVEVSIWLALALLVLLAVRDVSETRRMLDTWTRREAGVLGIADPDRVEVTVARAGADPERFTAWRHHEALYWPDAEVTLLTNPVNPQEHRLDGFFDLWNLPLRCAIGAAGLLVAWYWMRRQQWGEHRIVDESGQWRPLRQEELREWHAEIRLSEPRSAWMMVTFWLLLVIWWTPAHWISGDPYDLSSVLIETLGGLASAGLLSYALATKTRYVTAGEQGVVYGSIFGSQRVCWGDVHDLRRRDVRKELEKLESKRSRRERVGRLGRTVVHEVYVRNGRKVFSIDDDLVPAKDTRALLDRLRQRANAAKAG